MKTDEMQNRKDLIATLENQNDPNKLFVPTPGVRFEQII